MKAIIEFKDVSFSYDGCRQVLSHCHVLFSTGTVNYVVGPSGCGKSTLGLLFARILSPDAGTISSSKGVLSTIVLQFPENLFLADTVAEELALLPSQDSEARALELLADFNLKLADIIKKSPRSLSFGQRRLLAIAIQASLGSQAIILDEPSLGLDEVHLQQLAELLCSMREADVCVVIITHDLDLISLINGNLHILEQGRVAWQGPTDEFLRRDDLLQLAAAK